MSSILMTWRSPIPLATTTLPRPVMISKKLRASEMDMIRETGIALVFNQRIWFIYTTRRSVIV